ncbi:uncharacterized protein K02A2.6-like [Corticium candelabrum]|uniref:uncharacterized protein K02A2.6-like n=1 Tax=Corticium candelabrum TaxID=121492 RepID=UPI002E267075|nr:uncharacterized protein K02A2.6-like [Corticium candelabrum]
MTQVQGLIMLGNQVGIFRILRKEILAKAQEGHIAKTNARLRETMCWPGMSNEVEQMMASCDVCGCYRHQQRKKPLIYTPLPQLLWNRVAADLFKLQDDKYLLVVDYYSRFLEVRKLSSMQAVNVIQAFKGIFSSHKIPIEFFSDNGPRFVGAEFQKFAKAYGFQHRTPSPLHPKVMD